jgi:hypothetical protein
MGPTLKFFTSVVKELKLWFTIQFGFILFYLLSNSIPSYGHSQRTKILVFFILIHIFLLKPDITVT